MIHGRRLAESYVHSLPAQCVETILSIKTGDPYNGIVFDCPIGRTSRHVSFVEAQNVGHNWVFTSREWLSAVPTFIDMINTPS